jgi:hypothetical protein
MIFSFIKERGVLIAFLAVCDHNWHGWLGGMMGLCVVHLVFCGGPVLLVFSTLLVVQCLLI